MSTKVKVLLAPSFCLLLALILRFLLLAKTDSLSELWIDCGFFLILDATELSSFELKLPFSRELKDPSRLLP
jgi:hypothetical protein